MEAIKSVRNRRLEMNVPPSKKADIIIVTDKEDVFKKGIPFFEKLASAKNVTVKSDKSDTDSGSVHIVVPSAEIFLPMSELVDRDKEIERLTAEKERLEKEIKRVDGKLSNKNFVDKAPESVVEAEKAKGVKYKEMLDKVLQSLSAF